ncbi:hypothetical protein FUAX_25690 [Fulvitalea axinellae]|uniref:Cytochrome c domain-containing protein n=1 Tax=Fulvitalea axinellae TaxID=1182444 RepID=A0AAU9CQA0_9BACT|nr:hypothetical protein FUAX_25690 [Fulvitalea axinellae]
MKKTLILSFLAVAVTIFAVSCGGKSSKDRAGLNKLRHYMVNGQKGYKNYCANCHQDDGAGVGKLIPPLRQSDFLRTKLPEVICGIKNGMTDPIVVNGVKYDEPMPPNRRLTDLQIAEITTFIYNTWGGGNRIVTIEEVRSALANCK